MIPTIRRPAQLLFSLAVFVTGLAPACAQIPATFETSVRAAMASSIGQQRASVARQTAAVDEPDTAAGTQSFFVLPPASGGMPAADCAPQPQATGDKADKQESAVPPCVSSSSDALALAQPPAGADEAEAQAPFDGEEFEPDQNVGAETRSFSLPLDQHDNNRPLVLGAYSSALGAPDEAKNAQQIPDLLKYVSDLVRKLNHQDAEKSDIHVLESDRHAP